MGKTIYILSDEDIDFNVTSRIGNYACGFIRNGKFRVQYVGRSDTDLNDRLKDYVVTYKRFKYSDTPSVLAAWRKECENYHDFEGSIDNKIHPGRPEGYSKKEYPCNARVTCND